MTNDTLLHPTDTDLLAYIDGEVSSIDAQRIAEHMRTCDTCLSTHDRFRACSTSLEDFVGSQVPTAPSSAAAVRRVRPPRLAIVPRDNERRWYTRPSLRAAIIVVGFSAATLAVTPVRGWVIELFRSMGGSAPETVASQSLQLPSAPPIPPLASSSLVSFEPHRGEFTVDFTRSQTRGTLTITAVTGTQATGRIADRGLDDALLVTDSGFRVRNGETTTASYVFGVPSSVTEFIVRVDNRIVLRGTWAQLTNRGKVEIDFAH